MLLANKNRIITTLIVNMLQQYAIVIAQSITQTIAQIRRRAISANQSPLIAALIVNMTLHVAANFNTTHLAPILRQHTNKIAVRVIAPSIVQMQDKLRLPADQRSCQLIKATAVMPVRLKRASQNLAVVLHITCVVMRMLLQIAHQTPAARIILYVNTRASEARQHRQYQTQRQTQR